MSSVSGFLEIEKWDEDRTIQTTPRVTPAHIAYKIPDLKGSIKSEYIMTYIEGGNASFVFTDIVRADDFAGRKGSFVTQGKGTFDAKSFTVMGDFNIVEGTGTEAMEGAKGSGSFRSAPMKEQPGRVEWKCTIEGS